MNYKAEIDGLRALSILGVILFHINQDIFSGGFIGVDIFFLISGYLITKIIISDYSKKRFSLLNFYQRRIRRILPALFFMVLIVYLFNIFFLEDNYLKQFQATLNPTIFFYSNFYFWLEHSDYFSPLHNIQLLLHTWSLAIEEQFYILYPLLFISYLKNTKKYFLIL
jgi:peptidoglycan/LPS O-acetylase OafA/YrhL